MCRNICRSINHTAYDVVVHIVVVYFYLLCDSRFGFLDEFICSVFIVAVNKIGLISYAPVADSACYNSHLQGSHAAVLISDTCLNNVTNVPFLTVCSEGFGITKVTRSIARFKSRALSETVELCIFGDVVDSEHT